MLNISLEIKNLKPKERILQNIKFVIAKAILRLKLQYALNQIICKTGETKCPRINLIKEYKLITSK